MMRSLYICILKSNQRTSVLASPVSRFPPLELFFAFQMFHISLDDGNLHFKSFLSSHSPATTMISSVCISSMILIFLPLLVRSENFPLIFTSPSTTVGQFENPWCILLMMIIIISKVISNEHHLNSVKFLQDTSELN